MPDQKLGNQIFFQIKLELFHFEKYLCFKKIKYKHKNR